MHVNYFCHCLDFYEMAHREPSRSHCYNLINIGPLLSQVMVVTSGSLSFHNVPLRVTQAKGGWGTWRGHRKQSSPDRHETDPSPSSTAS